MRPRGAPACASACRPPRRRLWCRVSIVRDADPPADAEALDRLALWALQRYAPIVAADPPDGLVIDTTGAAHLHGGEDAMLADMVERLARVRHRRARRDRRQLGRRPCARPLCRAARLSSSRQAKSAAAMLDLPIAALRLPHDMVEDLRVLGFERIGELARQAARAARACASAPSSAAASIRRWDGSASRSIRSARPTLIEVRRAFAEPIGAAETIARYTGKLVVQLCEALEAKGLGARRLDLLFHRVDNRIEAIRVGTALPVRDVKRLTRLLCDKIETIDPGFGIEIMRLAATLAEPLAPTAGDVLADRGAGGRCLRPDRHARQSRRRAAALPLRAGRQRRAGAFGARGSRRLAPDTGEAWPDHWPRPSRLLPTPEPIETVALLPDHPPVTFTWRGIRRRVKRADGPERVFGEWWKRDAELIAVRDYFQVEDEAGERFWIYRAGDGEDAGDRLASLVPARDLRMSGARYAELQVHLAFLVPARRQLLRGAVRAGRAARHRGAGDRRPQLARRHRPRP